MPASLGSPMEDGSRRRFRATIDGRNAVIELDNGALFRLTEHATPNGLITILERKRDQIIEAAQRLVEKGHFSQRGDHIEVIVTAIDL